MSGPPLVEMPVWHDVVVSHHLASCLCVRATVLMGMAVPLRVLFALACALVCALQRPLSLSESFAALFSFCAPEGRPCPRHFPSSNRVGGARFPSSAGVSPAPHIAIAGGSAEAQHFRSPQSNKGRVGATFPLPQKTAAAAERARMPGRGAPACRFRTLAVPAPPQGPESSAKKRERVKRGERARESEGGQAEGTRGARA